MEVFKGAVFNIKFGAFYVFSRVFFTPLRYDYPSDVTLVLWQYGSRIRGGLLYYMYWYTYIDGRASILHLNYNHVLDILALLSNLSSQVKWMTFMEF